MKYVRAGPTGGTGRQGPPGSQVMAKILHTHQAHTHKSLSKSCDVVCAHRAQIPGCDSALCSSQLLAAHPNTNVHAHMHKFTLLRKFMFQLLFF